jgi:nucleoside recognition membrane protein YjiH
VSNDWSFVWTPEFLVGSLVAGLLLNVVGAYVVRAFDRVTNRLPAYFRRVRQEEQTRIQKLSTAASSDNALYAALAAEAARLRSHQLLRFFIAFVCFTVLVVLSVSITSATQMTGAARVQVMLLVIFLASLGLFSYFLGLESGRLARRLDIALRAVQRERGLPIIN